MAELTDVAGGAIPFGALDSGTQELVEQVRTTKCPLVITQDGRSAVVLVEAETYKELERRLALMERIAQGERDFAEGRTHTQEEVEALLDEWLVDGE